MFDIDVGKKALTPNFIFIKLLSLFSSFLKPKHNVGFDM